MGKDILSRSGIPFDAAGVARKASGGVFIASMGQATVEYNWTSAAFDIDQPLGKKVGDMLVVVVVQYSSSNPPIVSQAANWTERTNVGGGRCRIYTRIATGDANDDFTMPAVSGQNGTLVLRMLAVRSSNGNTVVVDNRSTAVAGYVAGSNQFPFNALNAGTGSQPSLAIGVYHRHYQIGFDTPPYTVGTMTGMIEGDKQAWAYWDGVVNEFWQGWAYKQLQTDETISGGQISYTPGSTNNDVSTQILRLYAP